MLVVKIGCVVVEEGAVQEYVNVVGIGLLFRAWVLVAESSGCESDDIEAKR
jgi:hypothetical protein